MSVNDCLQLVEGGNSKSKLQKRKKQEIMSYTELAVNSEACLLFCHFCSRLCIEAVLQKSLICK